MQFKLYDIIIDMELKNILTSPSRMALLLFSLVILGILFISPTIISNKIEFVGDLYKNLLMWFIETIAWIGIIATFREYLCNVKRSSWRTFIPLAIMYGIIIFIYTFARQMKDALVIGSIGSEGAVVAKVCVFFFALGYQFLYNKITKLVPFSQLAYYGVMPIVAYFTVFGFVLFNIEPMITPSAETIALWKTKTSLGHGIMDSLSIWPRILYYILAETWAVSVTLVFFWQVANRFVSTSEERKSQYPVILTVCQFASLLSGHISKILGSFVKLAARNIGENFAKLHNLKMDNDAVKSLIAKTQLDSLVFYATIVVLVASVVLLYTNYYFFNNNEDPGHPQAGEKKKKGEISKDGIIDMITNKPKLLLLALLTVQYGICSVAMEQFFKSKMKEYSVATTAIGESSTVTYNILNSTYFIVQSRISMIFAMSGNFVIKYLPWLGGAAVTPVIVVIGSILLFSPVVFPSLSVFGYTGVSLSVYSGIFIISLFKAAKYGTFDLTKEFLIGLQNLTDQLNIKNAEGLFGRLGKSFVAFGLFIVMNGFGLSFQSKLLAISMFIVVFAIALIWLFSVLILSTLIPKEENNK